MKKQHIEDLGFTFRETKKGEIVIHHHGKQASILRGFRAQKVKEELNSSMFGEQQQLMARLTGNYKHGNERKNRNFNR